MGLAVPKQISRFNILGILGKGAQGTVYLAEDSHLQRQVAIKTMQIGGAAAKRGERIRSLLDEALIAGKLQHPNIVTLYDAGEEGGTPYLVFEYVEGIPLARMIAENGPFEPPQAVEIAIQILDALAFAHHKQVVHRDIKPSNVIVMDNGTARVMDFGIAQHFTDAENGGEALAGTPTYMAPEYINSKTFRPGADIYAAGMVLYEMLAGKPAVSSVNLLATINKVLNSEFATPSEANDAVDEKLNKIVLKALAKDPDDRYASAEQMSVALRLYLNPEEDAPAESGDNTKQATLDFLLRRMRHKSDFPALSHTISMVNKIASSDSERVTELSNNILKDYALTNKLLKLVNSATYGQYGGSISTISRAVIILGFETVRNIAVTLLLYEHLQNKSQAAHLKDEALSAYFAGVMARDVAKKMGIRDTEEAFICAMFHNLGKLLVMFYFHEEAMEIGRLMQQKGLNEVNAATSVLGISYQELGMGVARKWNFPGKIVNSMRRIESESPKNPVTLDDKLRVTAELSCALCEMVRSASPEEREKKLKEIASHYAQALHTSEDQLNKLVESSYAELASEAAILNFDTTHSTLFSKARNWNKQTMPAAAPARTAAQVAADTLDNITLKAADPLETQTITLAGEETPLINSQAVLTAGVQDITNTLVGDFQLNDILRMILETMYRGMSFSRVLLCVRDSSGNTLKGRFGFGRDIDKILPRFAIPVESSQGAFFAALNKAADILISDVNADSIRAYIPDWYRKMVPAQSFILFPIIVNKKAIGLFYGDKDEAGSLNIRPDDLNLLKTLRNQAVLAIKQKY
ncbi:MAG: HDOD domain-containing protein [Pseudomonadota bacterium]